MKDDSTSRTMRQEYDFSKDERGKFHQEDARLVLPVYLEEDVQATSMSGQNRRGMEVSQLVNKMLRRDIALIETVK